MSQTQLQWQQRYAIGIPAVDHEHQELIRMINALVARVIEGSDAKFVSESLGDILSAIGAHFALEEKIMRDRHYDQYFDHKADHDRLLDQLRDIMDDYEVHRQINPAQLVTALDEWFSVHFRTRDARLHSLENQSRQPSG
jgi:hemerythrin-like metal-binding protein